MQAREAAGLWCREQPEAGRPPARHCTDLVCTPPPQLAVHCENNRRGSHPGCWRLAAPPHTQPRPQTHIPPHTHFQVPPPPRLLKMVSLYDCGWLARFWINPRCGQRKAVPQSLECS